VNALAESRNGTVGMLLTLAFAGPFVGPSSVGVESEYAHDLVLQVRNNGKGLDPETAAKRMTGTSG
jgi:hypothetical protein